MLTPDQEKYVASIAEDAKPRIERFDPKAREAGDAFVAELQLLLPLAAIHYFGSTKLGLSGKNEIDVVAIAGERFMEYAKILEGKYGAPKTNEAAMRRWKFLVGIYPVDLFLVAKPTRRIQDDLDTHQVLEARGDLRNAYERLKYSCKNGSLRDYTRKKFEFFNDILHPHLN